MNKIKIWFEVVKAWVRKNSVTIGIAIIVLAMMAMLFFQALALNKLETDIENQKKITETTRDIAQSIDTHAVERTQQINSINRRLNCIVIFFQNPNRANITIADIDTCALKKEGEPEIFVPTPDNPIVPQSAPPVQSAPQTSQTPQQVAQVPPATPAPTPLPTTTPPPTPRQQPGLVENLLINPIRGLLNFLF